jgi:hypothetical protein
VWCYRVDSYIETVIAVNGDLLVERATTTL